MKGPRRNATGTPRALDGVRSRRGTDQESQGITAGPGITLDATGRYTFRLPDGFYFDDRGTPQMRLGAGIALIGSSPKRFVVDATPAVSREIIVQAGVTTDDVKDGSGDTVTALLQRESVARVAADQALDARVDVLEAAPSGSVNTLSVTVDFGASFTHFAQTVVTGETWVDGTSKIVATVTGSSPEEQALMQFSVTVSDLVVGDGFTLSVYTPIEAKGTYTFACIGV